MKDYIHPAYCDMLFEGESLQGKLSENGLKRFIAGLSLGVVIVLLAGMGLWWLMRERGQSLDRRLVEEGHGVYKANCAQCHGFRGEGQPNWQQQNADTTYPAPPHDSTGHTWHHSDGLLYRIVQDGGKIYEDTSFKSAMPAFGDRLNPEEIRAVITYLKSLWGTKERDFQSQVSLEDPFP